MLNFNKNDKVVVNAELVGEIDHYIQNEKAEIVKIDDWMFPYELHFENEKINDFLKNTPRRFAAYELTML